jgi:3-oxoacyl-[acyl-carrier protein] reductase
MSDGYRKTVLITGSSRGLGASTAVEFAKKGYNVIINYKESEKQAQFLVNRIQKECRVKAVSIKADISREKDVKRLVRVALEKMGAIDVLVNNAGIAIDSTLEDKSVENFRKILDTNLIGTFLTCKYIGKEMFNKKSGTIINISSNSAIDAYYPYGMDYDASKAGVISLTHNFAVEYAPYVRVNTVAPGWINTEMNENLDADFIKRENKHILLGRFAEDEEIAKAILFAAESSYLNDSVLKIDGGRY